jgi:transposase-like protein
MAVAAMADPKSKTSEVASRLGITTTTLFAYVVNGDGSVKEPGQRLSDSSIGE